MKTCKIWKDGKINVLESFEKYEILSIVKQYEGLCLMPGRLGSLCLRSPSIKTINGMK